MKFILWGLCPDIIKMIEYSNYIYVTGLRHPCLNDELLALKQPIKPITPRLSR